MSRIRLIQRAVFVAASTASGQPVEPLTLKRVARGTEVRVWSRDPRLNGWKFNYLGATDTSLVIAERRGSASLANFRPEIPLSRVIRLEANQGRKFSSGHFATRLLYGAVCGALVGGLTGYMLDSSAPVNEGMATMILGTLGLTSGTVIGGAVGLYGRVSWEPVEYRR